MRWLTALWVCLAGVLSAAQEQAVTTDTRRLIEQFDFEERTGPQPNFEDVPRFWFAAGRPPDTSDPNFLQAEVHRTLAGLQGFPEWNEVRFDGSRHRSGEHSLYVGINGGSAAAYLQVGALPAVPSSDYLIQFFANTTALAHGHARAVAYLTDSRGRRIDASVAYSPMIRTDNQWRQFAIKLFGDHPGAAWIVIELQLLQPESDPESALGEQQVILDEVRAGAWFDDVTVWQLPRVTVATQSPVNILRAPQDPTLSMFIRDLSGEPLRAIVSVYDIDRRRVAQAEQIVGRGAPPSWKWRPTLPGYGWYLVDLTVYETYKAADERPLARTITSLLWLPAEEPAAPDELARFAIDAHGVADDQLQLLPELMRQARLNALTLSAWDRHAPARDVDRRQETLDEVFRMLPTTGRRSSLSLHPLPDELVRRVHGDGTSVLSPLTLLTQPESAWGGFVTPVAMRHGQNVHRWQLGRVEEPDAFYVSEFEAMLDTLTRRLAELTPNPLVLLPWDLAQKRREGMSGRVNVVASVSPGIVPASLPMYLAEWNESPRVPVELALRPVDATLMDHRRRVIDLSLRMIYGWEGGAAGFHLATPWARVVERQVRLMPDPLLGVYATLAHRLAGRRPVGRMWVGHGLHAVIFAGDGSRGGAMALWADEAPLDQRRVEMYLGAKPQALDIWGNAGEPRLVDGRHALDLTETPLFVTGIDVELARFRAGFSVNPTFINAIHAPQPVHVTLTNPWPRTISGRITVKEPVDWYIEPRTQVFSIPANAQTTLPLTALFPVSETAGMKQFKARVEFAVDRDYDVEVAAPLELGLEGIHMEPSLTVRRDPATGRVDAIVTVQITNESAETRSLFTFVNLFGRRREQRIVQDLRPGHVAVRRFIFQGVGDVIFDNPVRVGVRDTEGEAIMNKLVTAQ